MISPIGNSRASGCARQRILHANPIGTFFDPARVYDAFRSGKDFRDAADSGAAPAPACRESDPEHRLADAVTRWRRDHA